MNQIKIKCFLLDSWVESNQFIQMSLESWIESNQLIQNLLIHELNQFKFFESHFESIQKNLKLLHVWRLIGCTKKKFTLSHLVGTPWWHLRNSPFTPSLSPHQNVCRWFRKCNPSSVGVLEEFWNSQKGIGRVWAEQRESFTIVLQYFDRSEKDNYSKAIFFLSVVRRSCVVCF